MLEQLIILKSATESLLLSGTPLILHLAQVFLALLLGGHEHLIYNGHILELLGFLQKCQLLMNMEQGSN